MAKDLYLCDPSRNKDCTKECCYIGEGDWRPCSNTTNPNAAFTNSKGEAIIDKDFCDYKEEKTEA